ncbi:DUF1330 domain-containing protein [Streptomyces sp. MUM 178J]|uniref:DUF1330 domain-containing protein n=1 Tax=Streptomyces sp. MUM 178J TaxID=2791991 RepID=UPI001F041B3A|nr:DUF1330 domain-containing protein [Streptomyces sp. MUM 178J]WRQ80322.1 DUF1330 domain-containing protein [Streptomyces sp. MUM 178J]
MSAYVVMLRERVADPAELAVCASSARAARAGHGVTPVVGHGAIETLESTPFEGVLIHRFPSVEGTRAWHQSPAHQAALPHSQAGADYRVLIVEGVDDTQGP